MGLGLIGSAVAEGAAGAGEGIGQGVALAGKAFSAEILEKEKQAAMGQREESLARLNNASHDARQERGFVHAERLQKTGFEHTEEMQRSMQGFTQAENYLNRELQEKLETMREGSAERRHSETIKVQMAGIGIQQAQLKLAQNHVQLVPQADGSMVKMTSDGKTIGYLTDDKGAKVLGTKDVAASTRILMEGNVKQMTAIESEIRTSMDPAEKSMLRGKIEFLQQANERLSQGLKPEAPQAAAVPQPAIDALKKDPKLAAQFDSKYGKGAAAKALQGDADAASEPAAAGSPLVSEPPGTPSDVKPEGLIARTRRRAAEGAQAEEDRRAALKAKGEGYGIGH